MTKLSEELHKLKLVLDEMQTFPTYYHFKFIVPLRELNKILFILEGMEIHQQPSANGNYISVTAKKTMFNSDEIITVYQRASVVEGIISL